MPEPFEARPATTDDLERIWQLMVTVNMAESGTPGWGRAEIETWLSGDPIVIDRDVLVVLGPDDEMVGVEIVDSREPFVRPHAIGGVHPDHVSKGIGTAMLRWAEDRSLRDLENAPEGAGVKFLVFTAAEHNRSAQTMADFGMECVRYFMDMEIEFDGKPPDPVVPEGINIRVVDPETELETLAELSRAGFRDHYGFVDSPTHRRVERLRKWLDSPETDSGLWWVAVDGAELVGFNLCNSSYEGDESVGYVGSLAVLPSHRGRGLGRALLLHSFNEFHARGKRGAALGVDADSLTGATRLYESAGMHPGVRYALWEKQLRPGDELATLSLD